MIVARQIPFPTDAFSAPATIINVLGFSSLLGSLAKILKQTLSGDAAKTWQKLRPSVLWWKQTNTHTHIQCAAFLAGALQLACLFCLIQDEFQSASPLRTRHPRRRRICSTHQSFFIFCRSTFIFFRVSSSSAFQFNEQSDKQFANAALGIFNALHLLNQVGGLPKRVGSKFCQIVLQMRNLLTWQFTERKPFWFS